MKYCDLEIVDPCQNGEHNCHAMSTCTFVSETEFLCMCFIGLQGNGVFCTSKGPGNHCKNELQNTLLIVWFQAMDPSIYLQYQPHLTYRQQVPSPSFKGELNWKLEVPRRHGSDEWFECERAVGCWRGRIGGDLEQVCRGLSKSWWGHWKKYETRFGRETLCQGCRIQHHEWPTRR